VEQQEFLTELASILELENIRLDQPLTDGAWDSVATMTTIGLVDEHYGKSLSADVLKRCKTPQDILDLIGRTQERS
jgi:acyl carrier protein